jgi:2,3-bisphosphoglycerate-independent phosphoglycerate mutase
VPFILVNAHRLHKLRKGKLCDIAPTLLQLAGLSAPQEMTGESLILGE